MRTRPLTACWNTLSAEHPWNVLSVLQLCCAGGIGILKYPLAEIPVAPPATCMLACRDAVLLAAASDTALATWAAAVPTFVPSLVHPAYQVLLLASRLLVGGLFALCASIACSPGPSWR